MLSRRRIIHLLVFIALLGLLQIWKILSHSFEAININWQFDLLLWGVLSIVLLTWVGMNLNWERGVYNRMKSKDRRLEAIIISSGVLLVIWLAILGDFSLIVVPSALGLMIVVMLGVLPVHESPEQNGEISGEDNTSETREE